MEITDVKAESSNQSVPKILLTDFVVEGESASSQYPGLDEGTNIEVEGDTPQLQFPARLVESKEATRSPFLLPNMKASGSTSAT